MIEALIKGLAISLLLVFSVGPVIFTIIKQSINHGRRGGFSFIGGVWLSDIVWVLLSNLFSQFVTTLMDFKKPIGITGSLFLIGMGVFYLFFKKIDDTFMSWQWSLRSQQSIINNLSFRLINQLQSPYFFVRGFYNRF